MWKTNYEEWKNAPLSNELKQELLNLSEDQIKDAFYEDISFGTGGLRGIMGVGTNRINEIIIKKITLGFGNYLLKNNRLNGVAISYDNRLNSKLFAETAAKTLAALNIKTFIYPELRPTPMLSFAVRHFNASGGIMITASHNPKEYNGYKVYNSDGAQLNLDESNDVIHEVSKIQDIFNINTLDNNLIDWINTDEIDEIYLNLVEQVTINNFDVKASILYSPLHGTGGTVIPKLLVKHHYPLNVYMPHMSYDGNFSNTKSTNPEEQIAYEALINFAKEIDSDIILVTDPDADRLGVACKHGNGYEVLNGNQTAVISLYYLLTQRKDLNGFVFKSHVTSNLITDIASKFNLKTVETLSGFKFIAEKIGLLDNPNDAIFSCEESNGSIIIPFVRDKDAVQAVFLFAEIASYVKNKQLSMIDYLNSIYEEFGYYFEITKSYTFKGSKGKEQMNQLMHYFRNAIVELPNFDLLAIEDTLKGEILDIKSASKHLSTFPKSDTIKFTYSNSTSVIVRPSGTEPKLKIYFSSKETKMKNTLKVIDNNIKVFEKIIKSFE